MQPRLLLHQLSCCRPCMQPKPLKALCSPGKSGMLLVPWCAAQEQACHLVMHVNSAYSAMLCVCAAVLTSSASRQHAYEPGDLQRPQKPQHLVITYRQARYTAEHVPLLGNSSDAHLEHVRHACRIYQLVLQGRATAFRMLLLIQGAKTWVPVMQGYLWD